MQEIEEGPTHGLEAAADGKDSQNKRVGLFALFRYSKTHERWLMVLGMIMAGVAGFSMPIWLLLLAQSLETFNQIGTIIALWPNKTINDFSQSGIQTKMSFSVNRYSNNFKIEYQKILQKRHRCT